MAPGVTLEDVMLHTTKLAVSAVAKVEICNVPVPYPATPIGVLAKLHLITLSGVSPANATGWAALHV
jgi:hypothetical protein